MTSASVATPVSRARRWLRNSRVAHKLAIVIAVHLLHATVLLGVTVYGMNALSAGRAYVEGEGLWSKGEKEATLQLVLYADTGDESHYRAYEQDINVTLGDRQARLGLERPTADMAIVRTGFLQGGNHPDDVDKMAWLFRTFRHESRIEKAIGIWAQADQNVSLLMAKADILHEARASANPDAAVIAVAVRDIASIDTGLTVLEHDFSVTLGDAARWMTGIVVAGTIGLTMLFVGSAALVSFLITRQLTQSLKELESGATRLAAGELGNQVEHVGKDEVGRLAHAFNRMSERLASAVTESEQRAAALLESERAARKAHQNIQRIYERIPGSFIALDREFRLLYMNPEAERIRLTPTERVRGKVLWDAFPDLVGTKFQSEYKRAMEQMEPVTLEEYYPRVGRWFEASGYPSEEGLAIYYQDVTERKQAAEAVRQSEERYHLIVDSVQDYAIYMLDAHGIVKSWNAGAQAIKGYTPDEIIGKSFEIFYSADDRAKGRPAHALEVAERDGRFEVEERRVRKDGSLFWANVNLTPLRGLDGKLRGFADVTRDLTKERADKDLMLRLDLAVESAPDGIVTCLLDGTIVTWNQGAARMTGYSREEVMGRNVSLFLPPTREGEREQTRELMLQNGNIDGFETRRRRRDGTEFDVSISASFLKDAQDQPAGYVTITRDLTERMRANQQLRDSLAEKETLLREIHHRVKNNLQITSGLLLLQSKQAKDEATRELFVESMSRVKSMALVHEKLYDSKDLANIDFEEYVNDLVRDLAMSYGASERQVSINTDVPKVTLDVDTCVNLGLILNELVSNAFKHAFPGGRTGRISVTLIVDGQSQMRFCVRDDGVGLPPDFMIERATTMGLQLVSGLVKQVDGTLSAYRDSGTEFCITFAAPRSVQPNSIKTPHEG